MDKSNAGETDFWKQPYQVQKGVGEQTKAAVQTSDRGKSRNPKGKAIPQSSRSVFERAITLYYFRFKFQLA